MLSKQKIEWIRSLQKKRERESLGLFIAEGEKLVSDLLGTTLEPVLLLAAPGVNESTLTSHSGIEVLRISEKEMERISAFRSPSPLLGLFKIPEWPAPGLDPFQDLTLALDGIQDPGNLGTMVRMADWFGIRHIFCSPDCADLYNPKCVQSTMGALARVAVHYQPLDGLLSKARESALPIYGTYMSGADLYTNEWSQPAILLMGSEGQGISDDLEKYLSGKIAIPPFPEGSTQLESLNVAVSASIVCAEFRRRLRLS
ncbi:MAG: RNA methyltransferase [Marinilabiliales bacterium]|nr:RNA methyltransferase [Marinilabiliales bacterium]